MPGNLPTIQASVIATWPTPNYVNPPERTWLPAYAGVLQGTMTLMVGTRLYLRLRKQAGSIGLDDALLVPAFLFATMFTVLVILSSEKWGTSRHVWDVPLQNYENLTLTAWLAEFAFLVSTSCTKVSVLMFYRRLTDGTFSKRWKLATIGAMVFTVCYCLALLLTLVFNCNPTEAYWKLYNPSYTRKWHCADTRFLNPLSGVLSVVSDLYGVVLPMGMLRHFDADRKKKFALNLIFSLGLLVVVAGSVRTFYLTKLGTSFDLTWTGFNVYVWSDLEMQLALICASAPALRVFFRKYMSDPLSRAIHTATNGSAHRSMNRNSRPLDPETGLVTAHKRDASDMSGMSDQKNLVRNSVKPALDPVGEHPVATSPVSSSPEPYLIRTPADFEAYALQNLEKNRPPQAQYSFSRASSEGESAMKASLSEPFSDWNAPSKSWHYHAP